MELQLTQPIGIHLVTAGPNERSVNPNLVRGIVYAFAIQGAAAIAVAASWLLLRP
jgi:hypothetical protein